MEDKKERTTAQKWARLEKIKEKIIELEAERDKIREDLKNTLEEE